MFNKEVSTDLMWMGADLVLNVVDFNTGFQNSVFIENKMAEKLWDHFILCWEILYTGYINRIRLFQERPFVEGDFRAKA